jgi:hypothetical protein
MYFEGSADDGVGSWVVSFGKCEHAAEWSNRHASRPFGETGRVSLVADGRQLTGSSFFGVSFAQVTKNLPTCIGAIRARAVQSNPLHRAGVSEKHSAR